MIMQYHVPNVVSLLYTPITIEHSTIYMPPNQTYMVPMPSSISIGIPSFD